jgi:hypothetical protein
VLREIDKGAWSMITPSRSDLLAKLGYDAYRAAGDGKTFDGRPMPTWEDLADLPHGPRTRALWEKAAVAIWQRAHADITGT